LQADTPESVELVKLDHQRQSVLVGTWHILKNEFRSVCINTHAFVLDQASEAKNIALLIQMKAYLHE
jgi:hypothetical protein